MMKREWTSNQENAIAARGVQTLVSAAAGSGKTAVLTERVKNILCDSKKPCSPTEILVVTFTKAAASEMRERITKALKQEIKNNPENKLYLKEQLALLPAADICTIDSFCARIVKENFHLAKISADFSVVDDSEKKVLESECISEVMDELYENSDEAFTKLNSFFVSERDDGELEEVIKKLYDFSVAYPSPELWLKGVEENFNPEKDINDTIFAREVYKFFKLLSSYYIENLKDANNKLISDEGAESDFSSLCQENIDILKLIYDACCDEHWDDFVNVIYNKPLAKYPGTKKGVSKESRDIVRGFTNAVKDDFKDVLGKGLPTQKEHYEDCKILYPVVKKLVFAINLYADKLIKKKSELNSYEFNDILHKCIDLLVKFNDDGTVEKTNLALELTERYKEILIDEYQDTNEAQNIIFEMISKDKNNIYCVGDVKQSIYRFRLASPELFMKLKDELPVSKGVPEKASQIILEKNFRSRKGITQSINFIFSQLMSKDIGEIDYNENEFLYCGAEYPEIAEAETELHILDLEKVLADERAKKEALYVADYIKRTVEKGALIKDGENMRPVTYDDFCIIARSPTKIVSVYSAVFSEMGIPLLFGNNNIDAASKEVMLLSSLIKAISNPLLDVPLVAVLLSPLFGFTSDELAEIRLINKKSDLYTCLIEYAKTNGKAEQFIKKLDFYRNIAASYPIYDFVKLLLDDTAIAEIFLSAPNGERRLLGIESILKCAEKYSDSGKYGLSGFVRYLDSFINNEALKIDSASRNNGVQLMSIHGSKGLEFPYVILTDCSKKFNSEDSKGFLTVSKEIGIGIKIRDDEKFTKYGTLSSFASEKSIKMKNLSEELRLLYVAMTRAKEHLIIISSLCSDEAKKRIKTSRHEKGKEHFYPYAVYKYTCFSEWICSALLFHKDADGLRKCFEELPVIKTLDSDFSLKVLVSNGKEEGEAADEEVSEELSVPVNEDLLAKIKERTEYTYDYDELSGVLAKISASSVEKHIPEKNFFASKKPKFLNQKISGASKGTVVHKFLEFCDFKNASENLTDEIERLRKEFVLTDEEVSVIDKNSVTAFLESDIVKRLLKSEKVLKEYDFSVLRDAGDFYPELDASLKNEKIVVQGKFDCAFIESDGAVLIDYKTDKISNEAEFVSLYKRQLDIYKSALEECIELKVKEVYLYSFNLHKFIRL